jgi:plastocyanin
MRRARPALLGSSLAVVAIALAGIAVAVAVAGKDSGTGTGATKSTATGTITGKVAFAGKAPAREPLVRDSDPVCDKTPKLSEDVVVTDGRLRDVLVRLPIGAAGVHAAPADPVVVTQRECMYAPRVVGIVAGQKVIIRNGDPTYHNVRAASGKKTVFNLSQPAEAPEIVRENLGKPGDVVSLHCDVHGWMQAFAVINDHPFFAVTPDDGSFTLANVPVGTYQLEAWHPTLGQQTAKVTVKAGKTVAATFTFGK